MRKIEVHDTESKSAELITENISALAALFPEAVSEDSVDMEALRELLGGGGVFRKHCRGKVRPYLERKTDGT